jgi:predicted transcriptional regulator
MLMRKVQRTLDKQSASLEKTMLQLVGVSRPAVSHYLCEIDTHCH